MSKLQTGQLIYTRVERDQSPRNVSGFQSLYYSHELIDEESIEAIEAHLAFDEKGEADTNLTFRFLGNDRLLLAKMTRVHDRDKCGRQGNFVAHALVFERSEFIKADCNPLGIARQFPFLSSVTAAIQAGDSKSGNLRPATVALRNQTETPPENADGWSREQLARLLQIAAMAKELRAEGRSVAMSGTTSDMERVLAMLFSLLPAELTCDLSFRIGARGDVTGRLWAYGPSEHPTRPGDIAIDAKRMVVEPFDERITLSSFARWIGTCLNQRDVAQFRKWKEDAWRLCRAIDTASDPETTWYDVDEELAEEVWRVNRERVGARLRSMLQRELGPRLGERALTWAVDMLHGNEGFRCLARGIKPMEALTALYEAYCRCHVRPDRHELAELERICHQTWEAALSLWLALWKKNWKELSEILTFLNDENYRFAVGDLAGAPDVEVEQLYVPGRGRLFVKAIASSSYQPPDRELMRIVRSLVSGGDGRATELLIPLLKQQSKTTIRRLWRFAERNESRLPDSFVLHVEALANARPRRRNSPWVSNVALIRKEGR